MDLVHPTTALSGYAVVIAPTLHLVEAPLADALATYVRGGGQLLVTMRSGVKTRTNTLRPTPAPGPLADLVGATVDRHESLPRSVDTRCTYEGELYSYRTWAEWLTPDDAISIAEHVSGPAEGMPASTQVDRGDGTVWYIGIWPGPELADAVITDVIDQGDIPHTASPLPAGIRLCQRGPLTWVTNFTGTSVTVHAPTDRQWVLGDEHVGPYDVAVVRSPAANITVSTE